MTVSVAFLIIKALCYYQSGNEITRDLFTNKRALGRSTEGEITKIALQAIPIDSTVIRNIEQISIRLTISGKSELLCLVEH